jgi:hypothetical protein
MTKSLQSWITAWIRSHRYSMNLSVFTFHVSFQLSFFLFDLYIHPLKLNPSISDCTQELPNMFVQNIDFLLEGSNLLGVLSSELQNTERLEALCGSTNATMFAEMTNATSAQLCTLASVVREVRDLFRCETWYPLYETSVHEAMCYSVDSFSWIAATQFVVVFMSMVVLTCRVVILQDIEISEEPAPEGKDIGDFGQGENEEDQDVKEELLIQKTSTCEEAKEEDKVHSYAISESDTNVEVLIQKSSTIEEAKEEEDEANLYRSSETGTGGEVLIQKSSTSEEAKEEDEAYSYLSSESGTIEFSC